MGSVYLPLKVNFFDKINQSDCQICSVWYKMNFSFFSTLIEKLNLVENGLTNLLLPAVVGGLINLSLHAVVGGLIDPLLHAVVGGLINLSLLPAVGELTHHDPIHVIGHSCGAHTVVLF